MMGPNASQREEIEKQKSPDASQREELSDQRTPSKINFDGEYR